MNRTRLGHLRRYQVLLLAALLFLLSLPLQAGPGTTTETVDLEMVTRIRQEGFRNSKVMDTLSELTDRIGPRLTGSPNMKKANEWTRDQLSSWGLTNAHLEPWGPFGRGWANESVFIRMVAPDTTPLLAMPQAWTPSTNGLVRGEVIKVNPQTKEDLDKLKGQLAGKIVLLGAMRDVKMHTELEAERYNDAKLAEVAQYEPSGGGPGNFNREDAIKRFRFRAELDKFLEEEKPLAVIEPSRGDDGTIFVQGTRAYRKDVPIGPPILTMAIEHWGRISRLVDRKVPVELELDVRNKFYEDADTQYDTVAEIPGTDKKDEIVMLGAHLDSWHSGTGATDNAAGSAVMMEAVRILKALDVKPRRTIRIALWSGEEEGLLGSRGYVATHFGSRPEPTGPSDVPSFLRRETGPLTLKPEQKLVSGYFNVDNGSGKLRGVYLQENSAVRPIFEAWLEPFKDLGADTITLRNTGGTDHLSFDAVGIPGFQFIQDPLEYSSRTHHSNMDVYERLQKEDLEQASIIVASFVYNTAMRDQMLPRKPLPTHAKWAEGATTKPEEAKADKKARKK